MNAIEKAKFSAMLAAARSRSGIIAPIAPRLAPEVNTPQAPAPEVNTTPGIFSPEFAPQAQAQTPDSEELIELPNGKQIKLNAEQKEFVAEVTSGKPVVLIGPAGTGKTTAQFSATLKLLETCLPLAESTKNLFAGSPGIAVISYTNRATNNIRKNLPPDLQANCLTFHKLLEYGPIFLEAEDPTTGEYKTKRIFVPQRDRMNPLPRSLKVIIIEEASMFSREFFRLLMEACPHRPQIILLGDICQLPPIYDPSILGFWLCDPEVKVIELTQVHRQALDSPILSLATDIRNGLEYTGVKLKEKFGNSPGMQLYPFQKRVAAEDGVFPLANVLCKMIELGRFNVETDIILCPHEKEFSGTTGERLMSTININKKIATYLARKADKPVHHIIAGFQNKYLAVGDKVFYAKEEGYVTKISRNGKYMGKSPEHASYYMDHFGVVNEPEIEVENAAESDLAKEQTKADMESESVDAMLAMLEKLGDGDEERVHQSSHLVDIVTLSGTEYTLDSASEMNELLLGYALTVHKAQGCEWDQVVIVFHNSHQKMLQREMLYTAITRAKSKLTMFYELESIAKAGTFVTGVRSQRIKGNTLAEKAEYFKGKYIKTGLSDPDVFLEY